MSGVTEPPDKLLGLIYEAATEEDLWTAALEAPDPPPLKSRSRP